MCTLDNLRDELRKHIKDNENRLNDGDKRMDDLRESIDEVKENTSTLVEILQEAEGFFKFAKRIGVGVKWVAGIAVSFGVFWTSITHIEWR